MMSLTKEERLVLVCLGVVLLLGISADYLLKKSPTARSFFNITDGEAPGYLKVDVNTVAYEELSTIPYIGEKTAQSILLFREEKGRITDLNALKSVKGIGKFKFKIIEKYLTVRP